MPSKANYLVCIGASAGGLEALSELFRDIKPHTDTAYIVIQHLAPDHKSMMSELLGRTTSMNVMEAESDVVPEAGTVYMIPPGKNLLLGGDRFELETQSRAEQKPNLPIDIFLSSAAAEYGNRLIAIILSGTGSDGTRGCREVREKGGMVIAQNEREAAFPGMPRSIASNGLADLVLRISDMTEAIESYISAQSGSNNVETTAMANGADQDALRQIFALLEKSFNVNFSNYKMPTISRRLQRRMNICKVESLTDYLGRLERDRVELSILNRELLIGVTQFFRDRNIFKLIEEKFLPAYIEESNDKELRCWVPGCSTGEEAYTIAILFLELKQQLGLEHTLKIFATDIDQTALSYASAGTYPESIVHDLNPTLVSRYFTRREDLLTVNRAVREMVVFARHDLTQDPPFTRIDLVSCRNLLIYLSPEAQRQVLVSFSFSLKPGGLMLLGSSERLGDSAGLFETLHSDGRIFRKLAIGRSRPGDVALRSEANSTLMSIVHSSAGTRTVSRNDEMMRLEAFMEGVMGEEVEFAAMISRNDEILRIVGNPDLFLRPVTGKFSNHLHNFIIKDLLIPITTGVSKVFRSRQNSRFTNVHFQSTKGTAHRATVVVKCLTYNERTQSVVAGVYIRDLDDDVLAGDRSVTSIDELALQRIEDLERELTYTRENLRTTIENLETANEELQSTNEELLASNEELQSTNEELQSVNEELNTVANEHEHQVSTITELNLDIHNILRATHSAQVLLDKQCILRRFSSNATRVFNLIQGDVGRPIKHISSQISAFDIAEEAAKVIATGQHFNQEVSFGSGLRYAVDIQPYLDSDNQPDGALILMRDISAENSA